MATDINENSTTEEINAYVEQVSQQVEQERAGEKGDARITSEHAGNETTAATTSGSESATGQADSGEDTGDPPLAGEDSWIDDDLKAEVAAYGLGEADLDGFTDREELDRALRLFDKTALEAGRKALSSEEAPQGDGEKKQATEAAQQEGRFEITLDKDEYDEELVDQITQMRDYYESRFEALEARFQQTEIQQEESRFDSAVDSLEMPKLFGTTGKESEVELQRRQDLMVQAKAQQIGLEQLTGRRVELESLVRRVAPIVFPEEFAKQQLKSQTRKISKQSRARQGGGATRASDPSEDPREAADRLYKELAGN